MKVDRSRYSRSKNRYKQKRSSSMQEKSFNDNCRADPALTNSFKKIGKPEPEPFKPDVFQLEALDKIKDCDVLVSAPTGAGKTWIAAQAIERNLKNNLRTWYASPLKALSNSLYQQFSGEFGSDLCGIVTGERKENTDAPVIIGTTEILRNQLYDNMNEGTSLNCDLVILDEAHYLSDPDRGVVWEEVLIYLPPRVRLLLLSATVSNADEICGWLMKNRKTKAHIVRTSERPVPLKPLFLFPDGFITPLSAKKDLSPKVKKFVSSNRSHGRHRRQDIPGFDNIISCLRQQNLLPAIFFLKSRRDCDSAMAICENLHFKDDRKIKLKEEVEEFIKEYPHLENHRHLNPLINTLTASHHAGHLPYWKVFIEKMMNKGYLDAIFSTSTVAAGVNFPARTVVLVQSDKFNGQAFANLSSTELHQMTGRAGRRGMDNIGFVMVVPGIHQDPQLIHELINSDSEPLKSQIRINFSMVLNLLLSHIPDDARTLLELSFASYQQRGSGTWTQKYFDDILNTLSALLPESNCDNSDPFEVTELINERADLKRGQKKIKKTPKKSSQANTFKSPLMRGRVFKDLPCSGCSSLSACDIKRNKPLRKALSNFRSVSHMIDGVGDTLWISFKRHLRFLKEAGFVNESGRLTQDGVWASKLRLDQPLLIAEAIRNNGFSNISPEVMAGSIALFVWDRKKEIETRLERFEDLDIMLNTFDKLMESMEGIMRLMDKRGFHYPQIMFWPGAALFQWTRGISWEVLLKCIPIGEGDMASLIVRTADHLRQVQNLRETHPELAQTAGKAMELMLREPVFLP